MSIRIGNKIVASNTATNLATTEEAGIIRIATDEEVKAGLANDLAITPHQLANAASKTSVDEETIVKDEDDVITAVGVRTRNDVLMYNWMGTSEEYQKDQELGIIQPDWVCYITDDDEDYDSLTPTYGSDVALLDIIVSNQVLEGVDLIGKALQGSLIVASEYPDAYAKLVENKNKIGSTSVTETIGGIEVTYIQCKNGYKIIDIANKDKYDAIFEATGTANFFVLDEGSKVFYLPKTNNFLQPNLNGLGNYNEAGLPDIQFYGSSSDNTYGYINGQTLTSQGVVKASNQNDIYGNSNTVQPASTNVYIYYKVGNTVQADNIIELEAQVANLSARNNIPFTLFECKYSQFKISNLSWLLSEGQWNNGKRYVGAYNKLNELYQVPIEGLTVKLHNEEYTDYDFVINVEDETFRLPLKVKLAGGSAVVGNGTALGLQAKNASSTTTPVEFGMQLGISMANAGLLLASDAAKGVSVSEGNANSNVSSLPYGGYPVGISSNEEYSGIETSTEGLYLYFYIGETLQGLNDINLSEVGDLLRMVQDLQARVLELETNINAGGAQQE